MGEGPTKYRERLWIRNTSRYPDARVRERFARDMAKLGTAYNGMLWAMERSLKKANFQVSQQIHGLRKEINSEFGYVARLTADALGPILLFSSRREERKLAGGRTYEPPTIIERTNWSAT